MSTDSGENFAEDLDTQSYEYKDELKIRKILERETDWQFEFTKNDQYQYDLAITQWEDNPSSPEDNDVVGYVELERARRDKAKSWITGDIPDGWYYLSFLQRKVRSYDRTRGTWEGLRDDYRRTVYLKFNHAMDNCFAAPIESIHRDGSRTKASDGGYNSTYLKLDEDHADVRYGISDCVAFVKEYLTDKEVGQRSLSEW